VKRIFTYSIRTISALRSVIAMVFAETKDANVIKDILKMIVL